LLAALLIVLLASHANAISRKTNGQMKFASANRSNTVAGMSYPQSAKVGGRKNLATSENLWEYLELSHEHGEIWKDVENPVWYHKEFGYDMTQGRALASKMAEIYS